MSKLSHRHFSHRPQGFKPYTACKLCISTSAALRHLISCALWLSRARGPSSRGGRDEDGKFEKLRRRNAVEAGHEWDRRTYGSRNSLHFVNASHYITPRKKSLLVLFAALATIGLIAGIVIAFQPEEKHASQSPAVRYGGIEYS